jgi:hypothetical protein
VVTLVLFIVVIRGRKRPSPVPDTLEEAGIAEEEALIE